MRIRVIHFESYINKLLFSYSDPQKFSTTSGLGKALTKDAKGGDESGMGPPSPQDLGPDPQTTGSEGPGFPFPSIPNPFK